MSLKWKNGLTLDEVSLFVVGLNPLQSIQQYFDLLEPLLERQYQLELEVEHPTMKPLSDMKTLSDVFSSETNFKTSLKILCKLTPYIQGIGNQLTEAIHIYNGLVEEFMASREDNGPKSTLEIYSKSPVLKTDDKLSILFTRESLALWFYIKKDKNKANLIIPNFTPESKKSPARTSNLEQKNEELLEENERLKQEIENNRASNLDEAQNYPSGINNAIQVFNECWSHLPDDMERPSKDNLTGFIKTKLGQKEGASLKALLKLSTPDNETYGGKQKKEQTKLWRPKNLN